MNAEIMHFSVYSKFGDISARIVKFIDENAVGYSAEVTAPKVEFLKSLIEGGNDKFGYIKLKTQTRELKDAIHFILREIGLIRLSVDYEEERLNDLRRALIRLDYDVKETFELNGSQVQEC